MATSVMPKRPSINGKPVPYSFVLPDGRSVFVEVPADMIRRDRAGLGFSIAGIEFLDRVRGMAMKIGDHPTAGQIRALREALNLTQAQLADRMGVDTLTVRRWESGRTHPGGRVTAKMRKLQRENAARGTVVPTGLTIKSPR
jgi:DNA-binding transcriptional regulator YiaG